MDGGLAAGSRVLIPLIPITFPAEKLIGIVAAMVLRALHQEISKSLPPSVHRSLLKNQQARVISVVVLATMVFVYN